ncbi:hypothetical protein Q7P37_000563 [Cladosporium fusiforme]
MTLANFVAAAGGKRGKSPRDARMNGLSPVAAASGRRAPLSRVHELESKLRLQRQSYMRLEFRVNSVLKPSRRGTRRNVAAFLEGDHEIFRSLRGCTLARTRGASEPGPGCAFLATLAGRDSRRRGLLHARVLAPPAIVDMCQLGGGQDGVRPRLAAKLFAYEQSRQPTIAKVALPGLYSQAGSELSRAPAANLVSWCSAPHQFAMVLPASLTLSLQASSIATIPNLPSPLITHSGGVAIESGARLALGPGGSTVVA